MFTVSLIPVHHHRIWYFLAMGVKREGCMFLKALLGSEKKKAERGDWHIFLHHAKSTNTGFDLLLYYALKELLRWLTFSCAVLLFGSCNKKNEVLFPLNLFSDVSYKTSIVYIDSKRLNLICLTGTKWAIVSASNYCAFFKKTFLNLFFLITVRCTACDLH